MYINVDLKQWCTAVPMQHYSEYDVKEARPNKLNMKPEGPAYPSIRVSI